MSFYPYAAIKVHRYAVVRNSPLGARNRGTLYAGVRFCLLGERNYRCAELKTRCKQAFSDYRRGKEAVLDSKWAKSDCRIAAHASRRFRITGGERKSYSIPSGQTRTAAHASTSEEGKRVGIPAGGPVNVKDVTEGTKTNKW